MESVSDILLLFLEYILGIRQVIVILPKTTWSRRGQPYVFSLTVPRVHPHALCTFQEDQKCLWNLKVSKENDGDMEPPLVLQIGDRGALSAWSHQPFSV